MRGMRTWKRFRIQWRPGGFPKSIGEFTKIILFGALPLSPKSVAIMCVERDGGEGADIVYGKERGGMGVVSGSLMVKVRPGSDAESLLERWNQDENLEVGLTFLHIGVVELKTRPGEDIPQMAKRLEGQEQVERVKMDVIEDDILPRF